MKLLHTWGLGKNLNSEMAYDIPEKGFQKQLYLVGNGKMTAHQPTLIFIFFI